ncbi:hypothetical protein D9611_000154 [Ephemerocybe angulata]|uniref:C2H2-type domain-containing protein n=1 Tax=Ephemerocybe angulata TaxID=980116 RepID=A0A8H5F738_9AGAR|nr:hypothetical protein D9611_000154 [Tulosesus angulatus]
MSTDQSTVLFTCISCSIAFPTAEDQRVHYRSDHHRYNMKRRVAGLPPISVVIFNQRVLERKAETAVMATPKSMTCDLCRKVYTSENGYLTHLQSKKHKERELEGPKHKPAPEPIAEPETVEPVEEKLAELTIVEEKEEVKEEVKADDEAKPDVKNADEEDDEDEVMMSIDAKIAAARARLSPLDCLFCSHKADKFEDNLTHMSIVHSFFIPDADYLTDIQGLIAYLGEKIAVGNVCIFCNDKGKAFRSTDAVWKHMVDKGHCKIAYESQKDRMEVSDFYDFTPSYPEGSTKKPSSKRQRTTLQDQEEEEWEDVSGDEDEDEDDEDAEIVDETDGSDSEDDVPDTQLTYGDSPFELVLPSGARIGHRSMKRYYDQSFHPVGNQKEEDPSTGAALVRRLLQDKNSALVPTRGGFGAFGSGGQVVKARNRGEAREAGRHTKEFRDMKRREDFKTKVGFIHNSQKHFRDPLLQ